MRTVMRFQDRGNADFFQLTRSRPNMAGNSMAIEVGT
jgi:hypothetical protein